MSATIEFCDVVKEFGVGKSGGAGAAAGSRRSGGERAAAGDGKLAVSHLSLTIEAGMMVTILGTSGCGKTTLLKMVNRLVEPTSGDIRIGGESILSQNPVELRRKIGYVIQEDGLFPHMTVEENVGAVLKILGWDRERKAARVRELFELIGLSYEEYAKRYPRSLSGGQRQRVGLARALAADPDIMLLDEPFGALDAITRKGLQDELLRIHGMGEKTFLFVTHDVNEAMKLGDRVLILDAGQIMQYGTPEEILEHPANAFVRQLLVSAGQ